ncbi:MAG: tripartite tricarboxylate transporter TctB family protein [Armatimonadota bacterium]|nr:tripartite tricarboxylate transporter TctB family protein [Armatimonadota bacterium]
MRTADAIISLLLLGFSIYVVVGALHLSYMRGGVPGPGFAPLWIGLGLGIASAANLIRTWTTLSPKVSLVEPSAIPRLVGLAVMTVLWVAVIPLLGMVPSLALFMAGIVWMLGMRRWPILFLLMILVPLGFYLVFERWLGVPLPRGVFR